MAPPVSGGTRILQGPSEIIIFWGLASSKGPVSQRQEKLVRKKVAHELLKMVFISTQIWKSLPPKND